MDAMMTAKGDVWVRPLPYSIAIESCAIALPPAHRIRHSKS